MADDKGDRQGSAAPKLYFPVQLGDDDAVKFQEVIGFDADGKPIEYRHGNSPVFYPIKMPGLGRVGNVILRKGILAKDAKVWGWHDEIEMNTIKQRTVVINFPGEAGAAGMVWTLGNAWPTKIIGADLKSGGNEVAVESVEVAFATMTVQAA